MIKIKATTLENFCNFFKTVNLCKLSAELVPAASAQRNDRHVFERWLSIEDDPAVLPSSDLKMQNN